MFVCVDEGVQVQRGGYDEDRGEVGQREPGAEEVHVEVDA